MMFLNTQMELISYVNNIGEIADYYEENFGDYQSIKIYPAQAKGGFKDGLCPVFVRQNGEGGLLLFGYTNKLPNPWIHYKQKM